MYVINTMRDYIYNNFVRNLHTFFNKNEIMFVIKNPHDKIYDIKIKIKIKRHFRLLIAVFSL